MKPITLNHTLGYYTPGFFKLYIAKLERIDLRNLTPEETATFVHEYTHFLQDFTSTIGLHNIFTIYEWMRLFVTETYKNQEVSVPAPFRHEVIEANTILKSKAFGSKPHPSLDHISSLRNISLKQTIPDETIRNHPELSSFRTIKADAILPDGTTLPIEIGTLAAMEGMSHLAEGLMGLPVTNSPDYPYNTVRLLADVLCPNTNLSDEILFAICDVALQSSVPGKALYNILTNIQNGIIKTPRDGYDIYTVYADQFIPWSDRSVDSLTSHTKDHLINLVQPPMGEQYQAWIENIFNFATSQRQAKPSFLLDEFRNRTNYSNIVNTIGTPLMVNAVEDYRKIAVNFGRTFPLDKDVEFFPALNYILQLFLVGKRECPMQKLCQVSGIKTDNNCITNPPARSDISIYPGLCPVGALWKSWNLSSYQLNQQNLICTICK